jgi:3-hydroxybutyryl-CoA dehydrogenase
MLANEASEAVLNGVATPFDVDRAMTLGVNYPRGPLAWADSIGAQHVLATLEAIHASYGDDRYRPSRYLRRVVGAGRRLLPGPDL